MLRYTMSFVVFVCVTAFAWAQENAKTVTVRWHGQSFFEIQASNGARVVFDPHAIEAYGERKVKADLVLISHFHNDHTQIGVIENAREAKIIFGLEAKGKETEWRLVDSKFKGIRVRTVGTYHDTMKGLERGKNTVFCLEIDGLRVVFLGDLGHILTDDQVREIGDVDVLFIPVGGIYTINGAEAKKVVKQLKPRRYIIPMHYGTDVFDVVLPATEFLEDQPNVKKLPTNKLEIKTDFKPKSPIIAVLNWK
ncbi:MAG: MBL fold metallo-hydrolase [Gemmatales bacterium]|nr:MAG: MBL fold metallo-hydrolase [Gemmatales bacterium]